MVQGGKELDTFDGGTELLVRPGSGLMLRTGRDRFVIQAMSR